MKSDTVHLLAILTAAPGRRAELREALAELVPLTRGEPDCIDYTLFEEGDTGTFYVREKWMNEAAIASHKATPWFRSFESGEGARLATPARILVLNKVR